MVGSLRVAVPYKGQKNGKPKRLSPDIGGCGLPRRVAKHAQELGKRGQTCGWQASHERVPTVSTRRPSEATGPSSQSSRTASCETQVAQTKLRTATNKTNDYFNERPLNDLTPASRRNQREETQRNDGRFNKPVIDRRVAAER